MGDNINESLANSTDITGTIHALGTTQSDTGPVQPVGADQLAQVEPGKHVLLIVRGPGAGTQLELVGTTLTAGRSPETDIFLDDITVSREHARFDFVNESWTVSDSRSLNGTYVNRESIESKVLASGDELQIGKYRFRYLSSSSSEI